MFTFSKRIITGSILVSALGAAPALAFHIGLGNAAAAQGAKVINKANAEYMSEGGLLVPALPSCGSTLALFTNPPVTDPAFVAIAPIGHVFPPGHTFPADHAYFNFNGTANQLAGINLYAPGNGWITQISAIYYNVNTPSTYILTFSPCAEVKVLNLSVDSLAPFLMNPAGPTSTFCSSDNQGNVGAIKSCVTNMEVPVTGGQLLGTGGLVDFGPVIDYRSQLQGFVNPARHDLNRGFCPINYFTPSLQATYTAMLGGNNGATFLPRTVQPLCGTIVQDIAGTAQGDWYFPNAPNEPDNPHLALIHHNVFPSTGTFSSGTSIPNFGGAHDFNPKTVADGSRINYDFDLVNDTRLYCYDTLLVEFTSGAGGPDPTYTGKIVLLQLSGSSLDTLKIELQNPGNTCAGLGAASWSFTPAAVTFQR